MANRFPIGAWIRDDAQAQQTGGMAWEGGQRTFLPYRGQVVSWGHLKRRPGYVIRFGETRNIILAESAACDSCGTTDDSIHHPMCYEAFTRRKGVQ